MKKFLGGNRSSALYSKCFEMGKWQNTFLLWKDALSVGGLWTVAGGGVLVRCVYWLRR